MRAVGVLSPLVAITVSVKAPRMELGAHLALARLRATALLLGVGAPRALTVPTARACVAGLAKVVRRDHVRI